MNMQEKILKAVAARVEAAGLDFVDQRAFSNTGRIYIQPKGGFRSLLGCYYSFQDSYCTVQFYGPGVEPVGTCGFTHDKCIKAFHYLQYTETARIEELLAFVEEQITKKVPSPASR